MTTTSPADCSCIPEMDEKLRDYNAVLVTTMFGTPRRVCVETTKRQEYVRAKKPPRVLASYCPFCGDKYDKAEAS